MEIQTQQYLHKMDLLAASSFKLMISSKLICVKTSNSLHIWCSIFRIFWFSCSNWHSILFRIEILTFPFSCFSSPPFGTSLEIPWKVPVWYRTLAFLHHWLYQCLLNSQADTDVAVLSITANPSLNPCKGSKTKTFPEADWPSYDTHYPPWLADRKGP